MDRDVDVAFQSRFGRAKWLEPATDTVLAAYPAQGRHQASPLPRRAFPPTAWKRSRNSASAAAQTFLPAGGTHFARLDCLNDSAEGMAMLDALVRRELAGWWPQA